MGEAGILGMIRRTGYLRFYRSAEALEAAIAKDAGRPQDLRGQLPAARRARSWPSSSRTCAAPSSAAC